MATANNTSNQKQTTLSEEARQKLLELQAQVQEQINRSEISDYIKFKDGDQKILRFIPGSTRTDTILYGESKKPVLQYKFFATELVDMQQNTWTKVREWTISPRWANLVIPLLLKGFLTLEVSRTGSDRNDTDYTVTPYLE